jgi:VacB/RNase II family 3'-5' exoribonuclease
LTIFSGNGENKMKIDTPSPIDLVAIARHELVKEGFDPTLPQAILEEVAALDETSIVSQSDSSIRDLRALLWSSIDNKESRDLDQVEVAERLPDGRIQIRVGIADVDALVPKGSPVDRFAAKNTISVYAGVETFPMLPERLSTHLTSFLEGVDRLGIVIELVVTGDGAVKTIGIYRALLRNSARLDYQSVGDWLEGEAPAPESVIQTAGLEEQLRLQVEATDRIRNRRQKQGALDFENAEAKPVVSNGEVVQLTVQEKNRAHYIIENLMISTNVAMASYLESHRSPAIRRVVRKPKRWSRIVEIAEELGKRLPEEPDSKALADFLAYQKATDPEHFSDLSLAVVKLLGAGDYVVVAPGAIPEGHFGLAVQDYTHSTAPNRRYPDLLTQRLLKAVIRSAPVPYGLEELDAIASHCEERQNAARKVERFMRKAIAAELLQQQIGEIFTAIVTGISYKGTFVRLLSPPAEGKLVRGEGGIDVGDKLKVRLLSTDPERGFIDFERLPEAEAGGATIHQNE